MKRIGKLWLIVIILLAAMPTFAHGAASAAGDEANDSIRFELNSKESNNQIEVTVKAVQAIDVYAYELRIRFDALRWRLKESVIKHQGFSVPPLVEDGLLRLAHTQMGHGAGKNGDFELARLTFERIRGGDSELVLERTRMVNSDIEGKNYDPALRVELKDTGQKRIQLNDIEGHWAEEGIQEAVDLGFVNGYGDNSFRPQNPVTRAEFTVMLARALMLGEDSSAKMDFVDLHNIPTWARPHVASAVHEGWVNGYEDGSFRPNDPISRLEMAAIVVRAVGAAESASSKATFSDDEQIPAWGRTIARAAADSGLMQGKSNRRFGPQEQASRAEAVTLILNALKWELKKK